MDAAQSHRNRISISCIRCRGNREVVINVEGPYSKLQMLSMIGRKFIDIGANLTDPMFQGIYNGSPKHEPDIKSVLNRAWNAGLDKIIVTGGSLDDCKDALKIARGDGRLYSTVGVHPTRCGDFENDPESLLEQLKQLAEDGSKEGKVVAIGECGLDYDRLKFCSKETQLKYFEKQLHLATSLKLPLFLHCRNAASDLIDILTKHFGPKEDRRELLGVVHSFDGTSKEAAEIINLGFCIGINGCSLKVEGNLECVRSLPSSHILLETDSPWCEPRPTHAWNCFVPYQPLPSQVKKEKWQHGCTIKGRNEPANIVYVI
ncbi:hypothetical protein J437_LFUL017593 [Ladona fulva]|uniref:Deoxyribonuclease TATDN1 n=1 Tax=Ladona fulva TaxID=123851 RepID=A0A8K0KS42_LADFU|nr:hypothetical protein J437_LFUL017593 [Ladona fulva]